MIGFDNLNVAYQAKQPEVPQTLSCTLFTLYEESLPQQKTNPTQEDDLHTSKNQDQILDDEVDVPEILQIHDVMSTDKKICKFQR